MSVRSEHAERWRDDGNRTRAEQDSVEDAGTRHLVGAGKGFARAAAPSWGTLVPVRRVATGGSITVEGRRVRAYHLVRFAEPLPGAKGNPGVYRERSGRELAEWFEREACRPDEAFFAGLPIDLLIRIQPFLTDDDVGSVLAAADTGGGLSLRDFLYRGGWGMVNRTGPTGRNAGRPRVRLTNHDVIRRRLAAERPRYSLEAMATTLNKRGRQKPGVKAMHDELARVVAAASSKADRRGNPISAPATAEILGCTANSVYSLRRKGRQQQIQINSEKGRRGSRAAYWGFRNWIPHPDPCDPFNLLFSPPRLAVVSSRPETTGYGGADVTANEGEVIEDVA